MNQPDFEAEHTPKGAAGNSGPAVEERIVAVSLQYPDYGARRLIPQLEAGGIRVSSSAVYRILRRHGLQNRALRLLKLEAQQAGEIPVPPEEPTALSGCTAEKMQPSGQVRTAKLAPPRFVPVKTRTRSAWVLTLFNMLLLALLTYLGFHTAQTLPRAGAGRQEAVAAAASTAGVTHAPKTTEPLLDSYRIIWERNRFNASKGEAPAPKMEIAAEKIALAETDLGLKLVGTVVSDDVRLRRAFIENSRTHEQKALREGDTVGEVRIIKILRNKVVVATPEGDRLLTLGIPETGRRLPAFAPPRQAAGSAPVPQAAESGEPEVGIIEARLKRAQVESGLSENDHLMKQVRIFPYTDAQGEQLGGFRISYIMAGNILLEMGLRSGDVIIGVNGEAVAGPDDAEGFLEKLAQGGDITVQAIRRGRPVQLKIEIE